MTMQSHPEPGRTLSRDEKCGNPPLHVEETQFVPDLTLLEEAIENSLDCIAVVDMQGIVQYMNLPGACLLGLDDESFGEQLSWSELWSKDCADMAEYSIESARSCRACRFIAHRPWTQGSEKWWDVAVTPVLDDHGNPVQMLCIARDITELKKSALESKRTLIAETNHRIKNGLIAVASLLSMQARRAQNEDVRASLQQARSRVIAVAEVHRHLYEADGNERVDVGDCISAVVRESVATLSGEKTIKLWLECPHGTKLTADRGTTLALVAAELVTNCMKHAFAGNEGLVYVSLHASKTHVALHVDDDGNGLPEDFDLHKNAGVGMDVVLRLVRQLHGEIQIERISPGAHFRVSVPRDGARVED
jgi:PAS domain S-box-containing protein